MRIDPRQPARGPADKYGIMPPMAIANLDSLAIAHSFFLATAPRTDADGHKTQPTSQ